MTTELRDVLALTGPPDLTSIDPRSTPGFAGDKAAGRAALAELGPELADLQEKLYESPRDVWRVLSLEG